MQSKKKSILVFWLHLCRLKNEIIGQHFAFYYRIVQLKSIMYLIFHKNKYKVAYNYFLMIRDISYYTTNQKHLSHLEIQRRN